MQNRHFKSDSHNTGCYKRGMEYAEIYNRNRVAYLYALARSENLDAVAVRVALLFATFMQPEDREEVRPRYEWLMANANIKSRTTLSKALKQLEAHGFLVVRRYHAHSSWYSLPFDGEGPWNP